MTTDLPAPPARQPETAAVDASVDKLRWLLAHPEAATDGKPATPGDLAEYRHLLYDADADASTPAFPYPTAPKETC